MKTIAFLLALLLLPLTGIAQTSQPAGGTQALPELKVLLNPQLIFTFPLLVRHRQSSAFFAQAKA